MSEQLKHKDGEHEELGFFFCFCFLIVACVLLVFILKSIYWAIDDYLLQREVRDPDAEISLLQCQLSPEVKYSGMASYIRHSTTTISKKGTYSDGYFVIFDVKKERWMDVPVDSCIVEHTEKTRAQLEKTENE